MDKTAMKIRCTDKYGARGTSKYVNALGIFAILFATMLLSACASKVIRNADKYASQGEWAKAVMEYRTALAAHPNDVEYRSRFEQTKLKAAEYYYQKGTRFVEKQSFDEAIPQFEQGLFVMPEHPKLKTAMDDALRRRDAENLYREGLNLLKAGKQRDALKLFQRVQTLAPGHAGSLQAKNETEAALQIASRNDTLNFGSRAPVTLNFRNTDLRNAFEFIGKSFGINVIFDEGIKGNNVTLYAKDVTFDYALDLMLKTTKTFHKRIGDKTIIVIPDTADKRRQYEEYVVRTFYLNSVRAKEMHDVVKGLIKLNNVIVNDAMNSILVRDTTDTVELVGKVIEANDRVPAELILEVEILEINRSKAERLGLDFGSYQIGASIPSTETIPFRSDIPDVYGSRATLSLPALTFRFYKQDVDAKVLANPKIRVLNAKPAKIHIGDRVPLRASTITDATGQVRTTYDYKEIGIRLLVEPLINLDNTVEVKLGLEVSTLGENIGTSEESAFRIGTRNADTSMLLRDGETAILGGLIRDEERNTRVRLPWIGEIPVIGSLFSSYDNSGGRTDVLLTITPHVVRGWDLPRAELREFYSGNADTYVSRAVVNQPPEVDAGESSSRKTNTSESGAVQTGADRTPAPLPASKSSVPTLGFGNGVYEIDAGEQVEIELTSDGFDTGASIEWDLLYDKSLLTYLKAESTGMQSFKPESKDSGALHASSVVGDKPEQLRTRLLFRAERSGIAYLVYREPSAKGAPGGPSFVPRIQAARIVIR